MLSQLKNILLFVMLFNLKTAFLGAQSPLEIWQIQGDGAVSPYLGQQVTTAPGVVTAVGSGFFFLQSPDERADQDSRTSNGIYVASNQAANFVVGDLLQVSGRVTEEGNHTQIGTGNAQITILASDAPIPATVILDENFPSAMAKSLPDLEAVEGMLVSLSGIASGPSDHRSMVPIVATPDRPFREPGIRYPGLPDLPVWDGNPEIFWLLPNALGLPNNRFIAAKTPITASGIIHQLEQEYILFPQQYELGSGPEPIPARAASTDEISIASLNTRRLGEDAEDLSRQARKLSRYIIDMLKAPDILALQEIGNATALNTLRFFIGQLQPELEYTPFFLAGNDDIHLAFLVRADKFSASTIRQLGKEDTLPGGGIVFDRPPLLLSAQLSDRPDIKLQVLNIHLRSLLGIEGSSETFVREKRYRQSVAVARMVQELRSENLLVLGDFNAYPFTDGYVDVVNQISGTASGGAQYPIEPIVSPPLRKLSDDLPVEAAYSFVFQGSAQLLDHALAGDLRGLQFSDIVFARANADFPDALAPNEQLVQRSSDHDGLVVFLKKITPNAQRPAIQDLQHRLFPNPARAGQALELELPGDVRAHIQIVSVNGITIAEMLKQKGRQSVSIAVENPGHYYLMIRSDQSFCSEKLIVLPAN